MSGYTARHGSKETYPALTGLRGLAALAVFALHYASQYPVAIFPLWPDGPKLDLLPIFASGWIGVNIFFVLSGTLLSEPFVRWRLRQRARPSLRRYWLRRILRVAPAYWMQLLIVATLGGWLAGYSWRNEWYLVLGHLLMFFYIGPDPVIPAVGVWWTLPIELGFYLLLPLLILACHRQRWWQWVLLMVVMQLISIAYRYYITATLTDVPLGTRVVYAQQLPARMEFLWGVCATIWLTNSTLAERWRHPLLFFGAALMVFWLWGITWVGSTNYWNAHGWMLIAPSIFGLSGACVVAALRSGCRWGDFLFTNRIMLWLGAVSYSLYLWHFPVMRMMNLHAPQWLMAHDYWRPLGVAVAVFLVSALSYWLIERPFMRLRYRPEMGRRWRRRPSV